MPFVRDIWNAMLPAVDMVDVEHVEEKNVIS